MRKVLKDLVGKVLKNGAGASAMFMSGVLRGRAERAEGVADMLRAEAAGLRFRSMIFEQIAMGLLTGEGIYIRTRDRWEEDERAEDEEPEFDPVEH